MNSRKLKIILIGVFIYLFSSLGSYIIFASLSKSKSVVGLPVVENGTKTDEGTTFRQELPKTEPCPLNAALYSKEQRSWWETHRPLGVMIENHQDSRPQSGLSSADVVYEAVAEGGITRFLTVFYCQDAGTVGPVRSARTYFLDFISEYGDSPLYAHVGGANTPGPADALSQIEKYGWQAYNDLNQFSISFPTFWQDKERLGHPVATEHTMYSSTAKLWKFAGEKRGLTNIDKKGKGWDNSFVPYTFAEDAPLSERPESQTIQFAFWKGHSEYDVKWQYERKNNLYLRWSGGENHTDKNNNKQLSAKNVVILFMTERRADDGYENNLHLLYRTKGTGKARIFMNGTSILGTWTKLDRLSRTIIKDNTGSAVEFVPGLIWFEILPTGSEVLVE